MTQIPESRLLFAGGFARAGRAAREKHTISKAAFYRMLLFSACAGYVAAFAWTYQSYVSPTYGYLGFRLTPLAPTEFSATFLIATLPGLWMPFHLRHPSQLIHWIIYLVVYVPSILIPSFMALQPGEARGSLRVSILLGMTAIGLSERMPRVQVRRARLAPQVFWPALALIGIACTLYVYSIYRGNFRLVAFADIYREIRFSGSDLAEGTMVNYAIMLLGGAINPFLMVYAVVRRKMLPFTIGALGQLLLYATAGQKVYVVSIVLLPLVALVLRKNTARAFGLRLVLLMTLGCFVLNGLHQATADEDSNSPWNSTASLVFMRTLAMPGMLTGLYHDYFSSHERTHYSHVRGVNLLVSYPYEKDIGRTVGFEYYGDPNVNANAHFWAIDGLAAWGLGGVLVSSLFCGFVFWLIDCAAVGRDLRLGSLLCVLPSMMLANTSLFTTLLSGGLAFCILLLFCLPLEQGSVAPGNFKDRS